MKNALSLNPQPPHGVSSVTDVSEVFPGSPNAVLAVVARLSDGQFAVWAELKDSTKTCSTTKTFATEDEAKAAQAMLVSDLLKYAYPEAAA
jgi:hypothetical protein